MAECSFGKISTRGTFKAEWPFGTDLYGRLFYVRTGETQALIAAFDFLGSLPRETTRFREGVSAKTGIPAENIWFHELQVHAAPGGETFHGEVMDALVERTSEEVLAMMARAVPFTCEVAQADVGTKYSMNREQYVAGLGGVTIWSGMRFDEQNRAYAKDPRIMLLRGYKPDLPAFDQPIYFDNPVDPKAYLFVFYDEAGQVIGTMSRFAAHPDVAVLFELRGHYPEEYHYDFDWPGYLSEKLERAFDAPSVYLNGPCADLSVKKGYDGMDSYAASAAEAKRIGEELADVLLERFAKKHAPLGNADNCKAALFTFELPMRESYPYSREDIPDLDKVIGEAEEAVNRAIEQDAPAYRVKQLIDDRYRVPFDYSLIYQSNFLSDEDLCRHTVTVTIPVLQLGDYLFIGVPGESLTEMARWLRETFTGAYTIPVDQVNGYYNYMATPASLTHGGYTYWASWVSRDSIPVLKDKIVEAMDGFLK